MLISLKCNQSKSTAGVIILLCPRRMIREGWNTRPEAWVAVGIASHDIKEKKPSKRTNSPPTESARLDE